MATTSAADLCIERFHPVLGDVIMHGHTHYWLHGGRGSTKSSFISLCLVLLTVANPEVNVVVVRRFGNTLRDSVYTQVLWAVDPWRFVRCEWQPGSRRLIIFEEHTANKMTPEETGRIVLDSLTYADEPDEEAYYHDQVVWVDDTPDGKVQTSVYRRDLGIRARPARKGRMRKLSYEWLAGLREIVIDPARCPLTFEEFAMKEYERDRDGSWLDIIPDGDDHSIDGVRYAVMDDVLRG